MDNPTPGRLCATHNEWCPTGECRWCPAGTMAPAVPPKLEPDFSTMSDVGSRMNTTGRNVVFYCSQTLFCDAPGLEKVKAASGAACASLSSRLADTFSSPLDNPSNDKFCGNRHPSKQLECNLTPGHDGECSAVGGDWFQGSPTHSKQLAFKAYPPSDRETGFIPAQVHGGTLCMYPAPGVGDSRWCNRKAHHTGQCGPPYASFWSATRPTMPAGENQTVWTAKHMESLNRRDPPAGLISPHAMVLLGMDIATTPSTMSSSQWIDMVLSEPERNGDLGVVLAELNKILDEPSTSATNKVHLASEIIKAFTRPANTADTYGEKP